MANNDNFSVLEILAFERLLILLMSESALLRELIRSNPNYDGDWKDHRQYKRTRKAFRSLNNQSDFLKRRRFNG